MAHINDGWCHDAARNTLYSRASDDSSIADVAAARAAGPPPLLHLCHGCAS